MDTARSLFRVDSTPGAERISWRRLAWVGPLTIVAALAVNLAIGTAARAFVPSAARMGQLGTPLAQLTVVGAVGAVLVFAVMALLVRRPIFWYRIVAAVALVVSILPDIALGLGGSFARLGMGAMQPFLAIPFPGLSGPGGGPPGGGPPGGGPPGGGPPGGGAPGAGFPGGSGPGGFVMPAMALEQVAILILLHLAAAAVCVILLTTLTRAPDGGQGSGE